jgi:hypothetical protein
MKTLPYPIAFAALATRVVIASPVAAADSFEIALTPKSNLT